MGDGDSLAKPDRSEADNALSPRFARGRLTRQVMLRTLIAAASCTLNRLPAFDGHRPKFLDKPFSSFGAVVNPAVLDGRRAFRAIDIARAMRRVDLHLARAKPRLRSSK